MEENFKVLYKKFVDIRNMGWIQSKRKGTTGIGYTFETLLEKPEEHFPIPDFEDIEIKTMRKFSKKILHLFSITPDGDFLFPMKRALNILGYPSKKNKELKILNKDFNATEWTQIGNYRLAKIKVDRKNEKISLIGHDFLFNDLNLNISWSFEMLKKRIFIKLNKLAIVFANCKKEGDSELFYYNKIDFYKFKDFDTFISLIEKGIITISFKVEMINSEKIKSRATIFSINYSDLEKLYDKIELNI